MNVNFFSPLSLSFSSISVARGRDSICKGHFANCVSTGPQSRVAITRSCLPSVLPSRTLKSSRTYSRKHVERNWLRDTFIRLSVKLNLTFNTVDFFVAASNTICALMRLWEMLGIHVIHKHV